MVPSQRSCLFVFLLFLSLCLSSAEVETKLSDAPTAYEMLESYDFPRGILPEGVQSYLLRDDGTFDVFFAGDCEFKVSGGYLLHYKRRISGRVSSGTLTGLKGVSVKILFLWFGINEVVRDGDQLSFFVGPLSASFSTDNFEECPQCRCGFDCRAAMASDA